MRSVCCDLTNFFASAQPISLRVPCRWRLKRARRYSHIICNVCHEVMLQGSDTLAKRPADRAIPYALPTLLAACDLSAELALSVTPGKGDAFLELSSGCRIPGAGPELSSFWPNVQQHLTELSLQLYPEEAVEGHMQNLEALGTLTALQKLEVWCIVPEEWSEESREWPEEPLEWSEGPLAIRSMSGESLTLKLPHLTLLRLHYLMDGVIYLSCPKLTIARFEETNSFCIEVHEAALERLELDDCRGVQCMIRSPEDQLQSLKHLVVVGCSEEGHCLIESLAHTRQLETLIYKGFPETCMPTEFPEGLRKCEINPIDWERGHARGL